jgi:hypothetical protein
MMGSGNAPLSIDEAAQKVAATINDFAYPIEFTVEFI